MSGTIRYMSETNRYEYIGFISTLAESQSDNCDGICLFRACSLFCLPSCHSHLYCTCFRANVELKNVCQTFVTLLPSLNSLAPSGGNFLSKKLFLTQVKFEIWLRNFMNARNSRRIFHEKKK